jgi:hypothetical protein
MNNANLTFLFLFTVFIALPLFRAVINSILNTRPIKAWITTRQIKAQAKKIDRLQASITTYNESITRLKADIHQLPLTAPERLIEARKDAKRRIHTNVMSLPVAILAIVNYKIILLTAICLVTMAFHGIYELYNPSGEFITLYIKIISGIYTKAYISHYEFKEWVCLSLYFSAITFFSFVVLIFKNNRINKISVTDYTKHLSTELNASIEELTTKIADAKSFMANEENRYCELNIELQKLK